MGRRTARFGAGQRDDPPDHLVAQRRFAGLPKYLIIQARWVAERLKAPVLKTVSARPDGCRRIPFP
jgi:hypothetical protein